MKPEAPPFAPTPCMGKERVRNAARGTWFTRTCGRSTRYANGVSAFVFDPAQGVIVGLCHASPALRAWMLTEYPGIEEWGAPVEVPKSKRAEEISRARFADTISGGYRRVRRGLKWELE